MARLLIVDDDPGIRTHLATHLHDQGHEAQVAADAMVALATIEGWPFDAALSDVRMAGDGFAFLRELHQRHPEVGVVLMTAYATVPDAVEAIRGGAYDYLVKPFSLEHIDHVLARLLEVQSLRRENRTCGRPSRVRPCSSPAIRRCDVFSRRHAGPPHRTRPCWSLVRAASARTCSRPPCIAGARGRTGRS